MVKRLNRHIPLTCVILLGPILAFGQDSHTAALTKYTQNNGLSSYYITKILQDEHRFLWIGTQEGLNVFDGTHFLVFSNESDERHRLDGSVVSDITEDRKRGLLWVATSVGGICAIDIKTQTVVRRIDAGAAQQPMGKWMRSLMVKGDTLWMAGLGILEGYHIDQKRFLPLNLAETTGISKQGEYNISKLLFDAQGRMWLASEGHGIFVLDKNFKVLRTFTDALQSIRHQSRKLLFWDMIVQQNTLYAGTSWGLRIFDLSSRGASLRTDNLPEIVASSEIQSMAFGEAGNLMFSTPNHFYTYNLSTSAIMQYNDENKDDDWLRGVFQIFYEERSGKTWIGTQSGLASLYLQDTPFTSFYRSQNGNVKMKHLYALLPLSEKEMYAGDENGLYHINLSNREITKTDTATGNLLLFRDATSTIFVSNRNGLQVLSGGKLIRVSKIFPTLKPLESDLLGSAIEYNDSLVLFSSILQKGLWLWNKRSQSLKTFHNDSAQNKIEGLTIISFLYKGKNNRVYIVTEKSIIEFDPLTGRYSVKRVHNDKTAALNNFMDMSETQDRYWIATYGNGLVETDKNFKVVRVYNTQSGLSNNCVYRIFTYDDRKIIATTNIGLSVIDASTHNIKKYYQSDGLHANGFEQLCGFESGGKIYAGGVNGFTVITPSRFVSNTTPPSLFFRGVKIETHNTIIDTTHLFLQHVTVPNDVLQTTVRFSAINYSSPDHVQYAYRIPELTSDWIGLGNQRHVNLIGLNPGDYTVQIKACNEDNVWCKPIQVTLVYLPKWYQTTWFKLLVALVSASAIYALFLYRLYHLKKQQTIRRDIANDLHDDIGSTLNTLTIFSHLARREPHNPEHLDHIDESITNASSGLRDMIWVLDDTRDTVFELMERIKKFGIPVCDAHDIQLICRVDSDSTQPISKTEKRNLLMVAKESINNSIKYASCTSIQITVLQKNRNLTLSIIDDGIGFKTHEAPMGNGLKNIRYRAEQINFTLDLYSASDGTHVCLTKKL
jgi:ligand-binding sensor domain-containing protein